MTEKFTKILYNQITLVIAIFGVAWGVLNYLNDPHIQIDNDIAKIHTDIALINQSMQTIRDNHEAHMQTALEEIQALKDADVKLDARLEKQNEAIIRLLTIHPDIKQ